MNLQESHLMLIDSGVYMIREANTSDSDRIAEINVFAWRMAYRGIVSDDFLYRSLTVNGRANSIRKSIESRSENFFVYESGGIVVGFTRFGMSRDKLKPSLPELYAIYVDPGFQRKGIGRELMNHFLEYPEVATSTESILWVFRENHESRLFYESMGFLPDGSEQMYADLAIAVRYVRKSYY